MQHNLNLITKMRIAFIALCLYCLSTISIASQPVEGPAADFTLPSKQGENIRLKELKGQVVLLNFWASWCGPCREEMPLLNDLFLKYEPLGFTILGVNVESDPTKADEFLAKTPVDFPILLDAENKVSELYNISAMPTTYLIDRNGQLRYLHLGYEAGYEELYESEIKSLVRE